MTNNIREDFPSPFGELGCPISAAELRETAYEILVGSCRTTGGKPLTYIPQSEKNSSRTTTSVSASPSLQRSLTSTAASKVKKALGLKPSSKGKERSMGPNRTQQPKKAATVGELIRTQMRVSEQSDTRIRRALLRISAGQLGRRFESIVLPLELLQQFKSSDFPDNQEYERWKKRNLKILEVGLLLHPHLPLDKSNTSSQKLHQIIHEASYKTIETGRNNEMMQNLRTLVMSLACRSFDGSISEQCHWADGFPLNLHLYQMLLEASFDPNEETLLIEEVDEVLELIKKTWVSLGINQAFHNLCFSWVLFHRYITTNQVENDLLFAVDSLLMEIEKDAKERKDPIYSKMLSSTVSLILDWAEKRLSNYRNSFHSGNIDLMEIVVSLGVSAAKILVEDISYEYQRKKKDADVACDRVETYIRSSIRTAFAQKVEKAHSTRRSSNNQKNQLPILAILAQEVSEMASNEKDVYSPILKRWLPHSAGVAVATLHSCYGNELKQFISSINELTPGSLEVLGEAQKLEKDLVDLAVEDSVDSEDGGKAIIREMAPYEVETVVSDLVKSWIKTRVDRLKEWVDRNLQQEVWNPRANKERIAPSAVEVLRLVDEIMEAFFLLPITTHPSLPTGLISSLDKCLQHYIIKATSGCGTRNTFVPTLPALTRCTRGSMFFKKEKSHIAQGRKSHVGTINGDNNCFGIPQLCVRINSLQHIRTELDVFDKRWKARLRDSRSNGSSRTFEHSLDSCKEGIHHLREAIAYKVIFHDLSHVLWDGLYVGEASISRIEPFLQELEQNLEIISMTVHDKIRTRVITDIMKASCDGFLLVLVAGGPSRAFTRQDCKIFEEDFKFLTDLFWSNGDGLPYDLIDKYSIVVQNVLPLFGTDSESLIERFRSLIISSYGASAKSSKLPLPPTTGQWNPNDPNTVLRVLCYRNDESAIKFLKRNYDLPKHQ